MRFVFGQGWTHFADQTDGQDGNGDAGGAAVEGEGTQVVDQGGGEDDGAAGGEGGAGEVKEDAPKSMEEAIARGLEKTAPKKAEEPGETKEKKPAAGQQETETHWANGKPKKDAQGNELDDKGQVTKKSEAPKPKTAAELDLKPEERKALGQKAQQRFSEVITTLKAREAEIATLTETVKPLREARDTIMSIMQETNTSNDALAAYLEFNRLLQSTNPKDLEAALGMVEAQRSELYKALGREPAGGDIDLLAEFPDLKEKVADATITREDALEIANARRERAAADARDREQGQARQSAAQVKQAQDNALGEITNWTKKLAAEDIDYKAKEARLLDQVEDVIKTYPPKLWLTTLQRLYQGIVIQKSAPAHPDKRPVRPTGAKPGAKAPQNMYEAMWGSQG